MRLEEIMREDIVLDAEDGKYGPRTKEEAVKFIETKYKHQPKCVRRYLINNWDKLLYSTADSMIKDYKSFYLVDVESAKAFIKEQLQLLGKDIDSEYAIEKLMPKQFRGIHKQRLQNKIMSM